MADTLREALRRWQVDRDGLPLAAAVQQYLTESPAGLTDHQIVALADQVWGGELAYHSYEQDMRFARLIEAAILFDAGAETGA